MFFSFFVAALLAVVAGGTFWWQQSAWRTQQASELSACETDFYRLRHRRRLQVSGLLGVIAFGIVVGVFLVNPLVVGFWWCGVLLLLLWVMLLAMIDAMHSHSFFQRDRTKQLAEQAALQRELLERARRSEGETGDTVEG